MPVPLYGLTDATHALAARGIPISPATLKRYKAAGLIDGPTTTVGGRPIWDGPALDEMERRVRAHRTHLRQHGFGANRRQAVVA